jgi:hypothetical protein
VAAVFTCGELPWAAPASTSDVKPVAIQSVLTVIVVVPGSFLLVSTLSHHDLS